MSLIVPTGYGLASFVLTGPDGTAPYVTTCGVGITLAEDPVDAANNCFVAYASAFMTLTNENLTLDRVSLYVGDSTGPSGSVDSNLAPVVGLREVPMEPTAMSLIVRKQTSDLGRGGRGRMFVPGLLADGDVTTGGAIEPASVSVFAGLADDFYNALTSPEPPFEPVPPYLLHSEANADAPTPITGFSIAPLVGWIRGRIR